MKIQDIIFLLVAAMLLYQRKPKWLISAGCICLLLAIPLFATWTFFTAQRLTWYAAGFFLLSACLLAWQLRNTK